MVYLAHYWLLNGNLWESYFFVAQRFGRSGWGTSQR